jgi:hypothetical protein
MAITKKFTFTPAVGGFLVTPPQWAESLSPVDRVKYNEAANRQNDITDAAVAAGKVTVASDGSMTWSDPQYLEDFILGSDSEWVLFWNRFTNETNVVLNITTE